MLLKKRITIASILFLAIVFLHIAGILFNQNLAFITKPFLISTLVIIYLVSVKKPNFWFVSALFFSFWGDVLLLFKNQFFVFGLASFLLAHVLYIKITLGFIKKSSPQKIFIACFPFALFLVSFLWLIFDSLSEMKIPVLLYASVICVFGIAAFLNYLQLKSTENLWLFLGAVIFITSDSLIALNRFYEPKFYYQLCIMLTYIVAQYLICRTIIVKESYQK